MRHKRVNTRINKRADGQNKKRLNRQIDKRTNVSIHTIKNGLNQRQKDSQTVGGTPQTLQINKQTSRTLVAMCIFLKKRWPLNVEQNSKEKASTING